VTKNIIDKSLIELNKEYLINGFVLFIIIYILSLFMSGIIAMINVNLEQKILIDLRTKVFEKILSKEFSFFLEKDIGEIIYRLINELNDIISFLLNTSIKTIISLGNIIFFLIVIFILDKEIALISSVFLIAFCICFYLSGKKVLKYEKKTIEEFSETNNVITDIIGNIKTILYMRLQNYSSNKLLIQLEKNKTIIYNFTRFKVFLNSYLSIISFVPLIIIWIYGGFKVINGLITIGTLIALYGYYQQLITHIDGLKTFNTEYQRFKVNINRLNEITNFEEFGESNLKQETISNEIENLILSNITIKYNINIIKNFSNNFKVGDIIKISGNNGSGKSSLINVISGIIKPTDGFVKINNIDISKINSESLKRILAIVPQDIQLFSTSVFENIKLDSNISKREILELSNKIGFQGVDDKFLDRVLLTKGGNLSGGQKQKIAILRALISKPKILILDEATSSLDTYSKNNLIEYIDTIKESTICFIISHDSEDLKFTKQINI